jgi:uncharacterized protein
VRAANEHPNIFFDTSWWNPADCWALMNSVPPSRVLYASDVPFASPAFSAIKTARVALQAGCSSEQVRCMLSGQMERLIAGGEPLDLGPRAHAPHPVPPALERLYVTLCAAGERMLGGEDPGQGPEIARAACEAAEGENAEVMESILALLDLAEEESTPDPLRMERQPGFDCVIIASTVARTPAAGVPSVADAVRAAA